MEPEDRRGGDLAGNIVRWGPPGERQAGHRIGRRHWGKGIAARALRESVALERTRPLHAHVARTKVGAIRVLAKRGFVAWREDRAAAATGGEAVEETVMRLTAA